MIIEQKTELYLNSKQIPPVLNMVQGDTGRRLTAHINGLTLTSSMTAAIWFERPNGTLYYQVCSVSAATNCVSADLSADGGALTQVGDVHCQIRITLSGEIISTFEFIIAVHRNESGQATTEDFTWRDEVIAEIGDKMIYDSGYGYIRYTDGHMICYGGFTVPAQSGMTQAGSLFRFSATVNQDFPKPFASNPRVVFDAVFVWNQIVNSISYNSNTIQTAYILNTSAEMSQTVINYVAIGRWR